MLLRFVQRSLPLDALRTPIVQASDNSGLGRCEAVEALQAGNLDFEGHNHNAPPSTRHTAFSSV
jgi:hypothetical protein